MWSKAVFTEHSRDSFSCVWVAQQRASWTCPCSVSQWGQMAQGFSPALCAAWGVPLPTQSPALQHDTGDGELKGVQDRHRERQQGKATEIKHSLVRGTSQQSTSAPR